MNIFSPGCLDALCDWVNLNWTKVRHQDVLSLIFCLAALDFLPSSWEPLWDKILQLLKEKNVSLSKFVQLDLVWSLAVLNHLEPTMCQSVLNDEFITEVLGNLRFDFESALFFNILAILDPAAPNNKGAQMKLNQIWAMAVLKKWELNGIKTIYKKKTYSVDVTLILF